MKKKEKREESVRGGEMKRESTELRERKRERERGREGEREEREQRRNPSHFSLDFT